MAEDFVQLPADGSGKKMRARSETIGANTVYTQYVANGAAPSYYIWVNDSAMAAISTI